MSDGRATVAFDDPDASRRWEAQVPRGQEPRAALDELIRRAHRLDSRLRATAGADGELSDAELSDRALMWGTINGAPLLVG